ncbi:MAG: hypothetical protein AAGC68_03285 [Verrucomicrobiota bacterium]
MRVLFLLLPLFLLLSCRETMPDPETPPAPRGDQSGGEKPVPEKPQSQKPPVVANDNDFVGMALSAAEKLAEKRGLKHRVTMLDGQPRPATRDYRPDRVSFEVKAGKVVGVSRG